MKSEFWWKWLAAGILCLRLTAETSVPPGEAEGAALLKTDILAVFAHPDDETGAAPTMAQYALAKKATIRVVYCTRGEGGGNAVGTQGGPALGLLRETELRMALNQLGVRSAFFLEAEDFAYTEDLRASLDRWDHLERLRRLVRIVRSLRPEIILTQDPAPRAGQHGHHQAAGVLALEAFDAAADPARFPEQLTREGLTLWRPRKLYWSGPQGTGATIPILETLDDGRLLASVVATALSSHRSQGFGRFTPSSWMRQSQSWTLVKSVVTFATNETDLMRGLPVLEPIPDRLLDAGDEPESDALQIRILSRPAVEAYRLVCREQKIEHAAQSFPADLTVVAGEESDVGLVVGNPTATGVDARVHVTVSEGWTAIPTLEMRFSPHRTNVHRIRVTAPLDSLREGEIVVETQVAGRALRTTAHLHPVPRLTIPKVEKPLMVASDDLEPGWGALPSHEIAPTNVWEGLVRDARDSSATFRLAHDSERLYFEIRVRDDQIVSNLVPQDIRAHWRTDSVELCLDPSVGSPHSLNAFKLGIVPFDSTGRVGASRDADARPGPISETSPGTRLASWKTADGYALRVSIPLSEAGIRLEPELRVGLNVLVYDADAMRVVLGDNANKSRIAWSPRSGVQGRPEDWGRADFR